MMMALGLFVFGLSTTAYQDLQRQTAWRHAPQGRVSRRPSRQFLGPGDDSINLSGTLLPQFTGGQQSLDQLRQMANAGAAWPLIEGSGNHYGLFVIERLSERKSDFFRDGAAQQIQFDMSLQRIDDDSTDQLANNTLSRAIITGLNGVLA